MVQAGVDVSRHGGHAYPGMEDVYISELKGLDVTTEDLADKDSAKIDYSLGDIVLQGQVGLPIALQSLLHAMYLCNVSYKLLNHLTKIGYNTRLQCFWCCCNGIA